MVTSDALFIGFDHSKNGDITALSVIRMGREKSTVLNVFVGQEAEEIYEKLTGIKMEEGPGVLMWNHNPMDKVLGKTEVIEIEGGVIVKALPDDTTEDNFDDFCTYMNNARDEEIRREYFSGMRTFAAICEFWDITGEELGRIISNESRN